jgi:hypothetical protein
MMSYPERYAELEIQWKVDELKRLPGFYTVGRVNIQYYKEDFEIGDLFFNKDTTHHKTDWIKFDSLPNFQARYHIFKNSTVMNNPDVTIDEIVESSFKNGMIQKIITVIFINLLGKRGDTLAKPYGGTVYLELSYDMFQKPHPGLCNYLKPRLDKYYSLSTKKEQIVYLFRLNQRCISKSDAQKIEGIIVIYSENLNSFTYSS